MMPACAATMCVDDDTLVIVLDATVNGGATHNGLGMEWSAAFGYGTVFGVAACVDSPDTTEKVVSDLTDKNGITVVGGEQSGGTCWCKMTHPLASQWVYRRWFESMNSCVSDCASYCAIDNGVSTNKIMRLSMFGSVGD